MLAFRHNFQKVVKYMSDKNIPIYKYQLPGICEGIFCKNTETDDVERRLYEMYLKTKLSSCEEMYFVGISVDEISWYIDSVHNEINDTYDFIQCIDQEDEIILAPKYIFCFDSIESCRRFARQYEALEDEELIVQYRLMYGSSQHYINFISYGQVRDRDVIYSKISEDKELYSEGCDDCEL